MTIGAFINRSVYRYAQRSVCNIAVHRNILYDNLNLILHNDISVFCEFSEHQGFCRFFHSLSNHKDTVSHQLLPLDDLQLCVDLNISLICTPSGTAHTCIFYSALPGHMFPSESLKCISVVTHMSCHHSLGATGATLNTRNASP